MKKNEWQRFRKLMNQIDIVSNNNKITNATYDKEEVFLESSYLSDLASNLIKDILIKSESL